MKILVTGGCGFIGGHVVDALVADGHTVHVIDRLVHGEGHFVEGVTYNRADLRGDFKTSDFEAVVHLAAIGGAALAAREPIEVVSNNVGGTMCLRAGCERMPNLKHVIHVSSFSVYGVNAPLPTTTRAPLDPAETYGASKAMQELAWRGFTHAPVTILRLSSVYGRRMRLDDPEATIVAKIAGWVARGEVCQFFEDGEQTRDFVYVGDMIDMVRKVIDYPHPTPINVCSGMRTSLLQAKGACEAAIGRQVVHECSGTPRPGDMRNCRGDATGMLSLLGRIPTTFTEGARLAFAPEGGA
jgi:UDP-glucose 4-epimerase